MADVFEDRLEGSLDQLTQQHSPQLEVARDRQSLYPIAMPVFTTTV